MRKINNPRSLSNGFTLIEMLVTVTLVAILAAVVVPISQITIQQGKEQELKHALREIRTAIDAYKAAGDAGRIYRSADDTGYPPTLSVLVSGVIDIKDPKGQKIYFLRRIPLDPMNRDPQLDAEAMWSTRSYDSDVDQPRSGRDVYDVHSRSFAIGLDGRPYRMW